MYGSNYFIGSHPVPRLCKGLRGETWRGRKILEHIFMEMKKQEEEGTEYKFAVYSKAKPNFFHTIFFKLHEDGFEHTVILVLLQQIFVQPIYS